MKLYSSVIRLIHFEKKTMHASPLRKRGVVDKIGFKLVGVKTIGA
jgi:hypothetical protein